MKFNLLLSSILLSSVGTLCAQTATISGRVLLENQTDHRNVRVLFEQTAPTTLSDSTFTDNLGNFSKAIPTGIYKITCSKNGYLSTIKSNENCYSSHALTDTTLLAKGLEGSLSGVLTAGNYRVSANIQVDSGTTLTLMPGTRLRFMEGKSLTAIGSLIAKGSLGDSVYFTTDNPLTRWNGISVTGNSEFKFAVVELSQNCGVMSWNMNIFSRSTFRNNTTTTSYGGGAINIRSSSPIIDSMVFVNNKTPFNTGAAIFANGFGLTINHCVFSGHEITKNTPWGGVVYIGKGELNVKNTVFMNAVNTYGIFATGFTKKVILENVLFVNNMLANNASGTTIVIDAVDSMEVIMTNTTIADNGQSAITMRSGRPNRLFMTNCIVSSQPDWVVQVSNFCLVQYELKNCNFWNNGGLISINAPALLGTNVTKNANGDSCDAWGNISFNPQFQAGTWMLSPGSKCIDAGRNDAVNLSTDLIGKPRIYDGDNDGDTIVDMGAFEFDSIATSTGIGMHKHLSVNNEMQLYPNPAHDVLYILLSDKHTATYLEIISITGQTVYTKSNPDTKTEINTTGLAKGIYIVKASGTETTSVKRLILE